MAAEAPIDGPTALDCRAQLAPSKSRPRSRYVAQLAFGVLSLREY